MMYDNSEERKFLKNILIYSNLQKKIIRANGGNPAFPRTNQPFYNNRNSETGGYRHMNRPYQSYGNNHVQHPPPIPSDIADILNNAKYFIIKSGNLDNIDLARKFSTWATTLQNQVFIIEFNQKKFLIIYYRENLMKRLLFHQMLF